MVSMMLGQEMRLKLAQGMWSEMENCLHSTAAGGLSAIIFREH